MSGVFKNLEDRKVLRLHLAASSVVPQKPLLTSFQPLSEPAMSQSPQGPGAAQGSAEAMLAQILLQLQQEQAQIAQRYS